MARILWLADALRAEGLRVVEGTGWKTRGYDTLVSPLHGACFHHTASPLSQTDAGALSVVTHGREGLPGPIANAMVGRNGTAYVVASGKANHAGYGGPWRTVPKDDGNRHLFALEVVNNGTIEPWSETVLSSVDRVFAAVLKRIGKDATWCVGHKEWAPTRKIDPSLSMDHYRARLKTYMESGGDDEMFEKFKAGWKHYRAGGVLKDGADPDFAFGYNAAQYAANNPKTDDGMTVHEHAHIHDLSVRTGREQPV